MSDVSAMITRADFLRYAAGAGAISLAPGLACAQQKTDIAISRAYGFIYMATHVIEKQGLIEKHAARLGVPGLKINWVNFSGGGAQTDALLSGSVDIVNSGIGNLLVLWDRTRGGVKGICGTAGHNLRLITRDARIKTLADFGPSDRIAVPTVRVSTHAVILEMACAQQFGPDHWARLDPNTVQLGHPEAVAALSNPRHEVRSHFSAPPYDVMELATMPDARVVLTSEQVLGGPCAGAQFFTTTKFADANPRIVEAVKAATLEAIDVIMNSAPVAVAAYRDINHDKMSADDILAILEKPGMKAFLAAPRGTMKLATHMFRIGTLKKQPAAWTDYYLSVCHDLPGD